MDVLKDKKTKSYSYISRYSAVYYYYHTLDNKYLYGMTKQLSDETSYVLHKIKETDSLDSLANHYYGRPDFFWIIADFNRITDPFICLKDLPDKTIKIPAVSNLNYKQVRE